MCQTIIFKMYTLKAFSGSFNWNWVVGFAIMSISIFGSGWGGAKRDYRLLLNKYITHSSNAVGRNLISAGIHVFIYPFHYSICSLLIHSWILFEIIFLDDGRNNRASWQRKNGKKSLEWNFYFLNHFIWVNSEFSVVHFPDHIYSKWI